MQFSTLDQWLVWLETLHPRSIDLGLERVERVAKNLQLLPLLFRVVTVAGTNGKGSCVAFISSILQSAGYTTACYTSPHLINFTERLTLNHEPFNEAAWCGAFEKVNAALGEVTLTYFEFTTLAALLLLKQAKPDIAILEIGLGGRLDAVNIVSPDVAVISTIALDHMEWLGDTREAIGREKAGIMRPHQPVVCGDPDPPQSVLNHARECDAPLYCLGKDFEYFPSSSVNDSNHSPAFWTWRSKQQTLSNLPIPHLILQNAATSLQVIELLHPYFLINTDAILAGLRSAYLPARFEIIATSPQRILDVAHNPAAGKWLNQSLTQSPCSGKTLAVVGMLADKDIKQTLAPLISTINEWHVGGLAVARGASERQLGDYLVHLQAKNIHLYPSVTEAYQEAVARAEVNDRIVAFGSFYTVAEIYKFQSKTT
jgi:dihydrofolate synthase / folylpolyglutamate synthase